MNQQFVNDLARRLADAVPPGAAELRETLEKNFRGLLMGALERADLVSREEFDVQRKVLARTREKLAALEQAVAALEMERRAGEP